jgi:hypothetical protein
VVVVFDALVLVFGLDVLLLDDELLLVLVSPPVVEPSVSDVPVDPPNCCEAGSPFWCEDDWAGAPWLAAIAATDANAVATTTPAAAIRTLADCRGVPLRLGGLSKARSSSLT